MEIIISKMEIIISKMDFVPRSRDQKATKAENLIFGHLSPE